MAVDDLALLILRLAVGLTFAAHGAQKAFGWWGGPGPANWTRALHGMGFHPPLLFAAASIGAELVGGLALAIGFMTPLAAAILVAQAVVIAVHVHLPNGFFSQHNGLEFPLLLGAGALVAGLMGAGAISVDALLRLDLAPNVRAFVALMGLAFGLAALLAPRMPRPVRPPLGRAR